ncbi:MAG TPA: PEP/pyruvate-binding domain-containing protein, partial [Myxococcaceae bacterium]|nr:PEP/pyruvate-binding domain-containing protein [Myxococcaceae bacterium]
GGKAVGLLRLLRHGCDVPPFFAIDANAFLSDGSLGVRGELEVARALEELGNGPWAARSSAVAEDGERASFAGQLESVLGAEDLSAVLAAIRVCRMSGESERVRAYRALHGIDAGEVAVVVQRMVDATAAGVVFSATPEAPEHVLVSATWGLGEGVVQGSADCDTWHVAPDGELIARIEDKRLAIRARGGRTEAVAVQVEERARPALEERAVRELAALARRLADAEGRPVDLEFAVAAGRLWLLQLRPVTARIPGGRRLLWDNSNIVESFSGTTTPMTFSFASRCYAIVYQLFCGMMGVRSAVLERHAPVFQRMVGFIRGRVYYNLNAWYLVLTLLPGFRLTRRWMEQMMGVSEVASDADALADRSGRVRDGWEVLRSVVGLLWRGLRLERDVRRFRAIVARALDETRDVDFAAVEPLELADRYSALERRLLWAWTPPIVNDFLLMVFNGLLRQLCAKWSGPGGAELANGLLSGEGVESAAPAHETLRIAEGVRANAALNALFASDLPDREVLVQARRHAMFAEWLDAYLERYGDRCADELKLEVPTLREAPEFLAGAIRACLLRNGGAQRRQPSGLREEAETRLFARVGRIRALVLRFLLSQARRRMAQRESLRFLRTRVFGLVRRIVKGAGVQLARAGALEHAADVWLLSIEELLGYLRGTTVTWDLRALVSMRRAEAERWRDAEPPAERFHTYGAVPVHNAFRSAPRPAIPFDGNTLAGVPCCPGRVEGVVRVLSDPAGAGQLRGEILAAERTDPGWVPLFPGISGLLVERGSVLSHSAVVARELGIPTIVGIRGLTAAVVGGSRVRMDGGRGTVERLP